MRPISGYRDVEASSDYERLEAGGYVIRITAVTNDDAKEYLSLVYDIAEGPEAGRYKSELPENDFRHRFIRSYKEKALPMFKAFTVALDESNGTNITDMIETGFNENLLIGKILGVVFGYEEYETNDGNVKERLRVASVMSADRIRKGDFKIPELKKLKESDPPAVSPVPGFSVIPANDLPF